MRSIAVVLVAVLLLAVSAEHFLHRQPQPERTGRPNYDYATLPYLRDSTPPPRKPREGALSYASRLNRYVHRSTYHCHFMGSPSILERVALPDDPFRQGSMVRSRFECGQCAQRSYLLTEYLSRAGIPSRILGLKGHVVVLAGDYILDPDFGVGPLNYSSPSLYDEAKAAYAKAPQDGVNYAALLASRGDNFNYNMRRMSTRLAGQKMAYTAADFLAAMLVLLTVLLVRRARLKRQSALVAEIRPKARNFAGG